MRYADIYKCDIVNAPNINTTLFVQGCDAKCEGCFNPESWDFNGGTEWTDDTEKQFMSFLNKPYIAGAVILGGEPMHPRNIETVSRIIHNIKSTYPNKTVWVYTGFTYEYLYENFYYALVNIDVLVDGRFDKSLKYLTLPFKGSTNQRIIDIQQSLQQNKIILYE